MWGTLIHWATPQCLTLAPLLTNRMTLPLQTTLAWNSVWRQGAILEKKEEFSASPDSFFTHTVLK